MLSISNSDDYKEICANYVQTVVRKNESISYEDFGLDDHDIEFLKDWEINEIW